MIIVKSSPHHFLIRSDLGNLTMIRVSAGLHPISAISSLSPVSQIAVIGMGAHPFLPSRMLHHSLVLGRGHRPYADFWVRVVCAQLENND